MPPIFRINARPQIGELHPLLLADQYREDAGDETYGFSFLSEKTSKSKCHFKGSTFSSAKFKMLGVVPVWGFNLRPSARQLSPALYNTGQAAVTTSLLHCCILTLWQTFLKVSFSSMTSELVRFSVEFSWYRNVPSFSSWKNKKTVQSMRRDSVGNCILTLIGWLVTYFGCSIVVCSICRLDVTYFFLLIISRWILRFLTNTEIKKKKNCTSYAKDVLTAFSVCLVSLSDVMSWNFDWSKSFRRELTPESVYAGERQTNCFIF